MHDISPVLAGTFDNPAYAAATANFTAGGATVASTNVPAVDPTSDAAGVDARRYTKFDRTASDAGSADFSFSDLLDLVNPLQHIPVVSSVYRAVTGETINPVSRVAGDILYGGAIGVASAVMGGIDATVNSVIESQTGKDAPGYMIASLFGGQTPATGSQQTQLASAATPAKTNAPVQTAAATPATQPPAAASAGAIMQVAAANSAPAASTDNSAPAAKSFPLDRSKLPYGGVMAPSNNMQEQNMAMALSESSHAMRIGHMIYTSPLMNGPHPLPVTSSPMPTVAASSSNAAIAATTSAIPEAASAATPAPAIAAAIASPAATPAVMAASAPTASAASPATAQPSAPKNPIPQGLIDDMLVLKALGQYKNIAAGPANTGVNLDVSN